MGNKIYCYPLTVADSYSRYVFTAKGMHSANTKGSKAEFINIFRRYGLPEQMHTDYTEKKQMPKFMRKFLQRKEIDMKTSA